VGIAAGEIELGAQLTVRESQAAVMYCPGQAYDACGPERPRWSPATSRSSSSCAPLPASFVLIVDHGTLHGLLWREGPEKK